jgi:microcompartment protein CcmL/EutN
MSFIRALGIFELSSIARGVVTADAIMKKAGVELLASRPVSGGKFLIFFRGGVAEVEESFAAGKSVAKDQVIDAFFVSALHPSIWPFLPDPMSETKKAHRQHAACIIESKTVCRAIWAADTALKVANVTMTDMRLAVGISGKAIFSLCGTLPDIQAAEEAMKEKGEGLTIEVIPAPAAEISGRLFF